MEIELERPRGIRKAVDAEAHRGRGGPRRVLSESRRDRGCGREEKRQTQCARRRNER